MNCQEFDGVVVEVGRERVADAAALAHAEACPRCAARLASECAVTAMLRAYGASAELSEAPPPVENALLAAYRRETGAGPVRAYARRWRIWAPVAVAAMVVLAVALQYKGPAPLPAPSEGVAEVTTPYYPIEYDTDLDALEGAPVVRVELPRTVLVSFGLPMNPERVAEPVQADLVLDRDGIARAIRFVN